MPGLVLVMVVVLDLATGPEPAIGLAVMCPLLAANLVGPRETAGWALIALAAAAALGVEIDAYSADGLPSQATRLAGIGVGGALAVGVSSVRLQREARLANVLRVAGVAQRAILRPVPARIGDLLLVARYESAAADASIGGDLYAAHPTPFGVRLLVGDVRGKGLEAVRLAAVVLGAFHERAHERADLVTLAMDLDAAVRRVLSESGPDAPAVSEDFVTAVVVQVDAAHRMTLVTLGHPPPLLLRAGSFVGVGPVSPLPPLGLASGVDDVTATPVQLRAGDRVLLHTDGLTEARRPADRAFFGLDDVVRQAMADRSLEAGVDAVLASLGRWTGGELADDVALVAVEVLPAEG